MGKGPSQEPIPTHLTSPMLMSVGLYSMEFHVSLIDRRDLSGEIYRQIRRAIVDGRLRPGESLPPSRELARRLSVARSTVTVAYDRLAGEGFVSSQVGAGTFVSEHIAASTHEMKRRPADGRCGHYRFGVRSLCLRLSPRPRNSTFARVYPMHTCSPMIDGADYSLASYAPRSSATVCTVIPQAIGVCARPLLVTSESLEVWKLQRTMSLS
jgi:DNA-binding transcriptional regulator YhcF (GntR family)